MNQVVQSSKILKTLPWGEEIYLEIPIFKKSLNKFYARHGRNAEGREYLEFSKFGPLPNEENKTYRQKFRLYNPAHWAAVKHYVENDLIPSLGWDMSDAQKAFEELQRQEKSAEPAK